MEMLDLVGLSERARHRVAKFSGGMKRRVNLAIALMCIPELLFLDEPTRLGDPTTVTLEDVFLHLTGRRLRDEG